MAPICEKPNDPDPDGITPFEHARKNGFEEIKAILIPLLANVDEKGIDELEILDDITMDEDAELDVDSDDDMLSCAYCDITFQNYISLNEHVENTHMPKI